MHIINNFRDIKKLTVKELKDFIDEKHYRRIEFLKENSYYSMKHQKKKDVFLLATKLIEKIPDATINLKQYYQPYLKIKNTKQVKQPKLITQQSKTCQNPNIVDKSVTTEHPKTSHKLFKTTRQAEKFSKEGYSKSFTSPLYIKAKNSKKILDAKVTKRSHAYKGYASSYNVKILNSFNLELRL